MKLQRLIETLGGKLVQGDPKLEVDGVSSGEFASPTEVAFADSGTAASIA
jgi:hypothetical protein